MEEELEKLSETLKLQHSDSIEAQIRRLNKQCSIQIDNNTESVSKDFNR